ncbi:MAG: hypothetical protein ACFFDI_11820 [Promethearchaeota archaeon]
MQKLEPRSLKYIEKNAFCPLCGAANLVAGEERKTGTKLIICATCENIVSKLE